MHRLRSSHHFPNRRGCMLPLKKVHHIPNVKPLLLTLESINVPLISASDVLLTPCQGHISPSQMATRSGSLIREVPKSRVRNEVWVRPLRPTRGGHVSASNVILRDCNFGQDCVRMWTACKESVGRTKTPREQSDSSARWRISKRGYDFANSAMCPSDNKRLMSCAR
jgi:hypothetical protein